MDVVKIRLQQQKHPFVRGTCFLYSNGLMDHLCTACADVNSSQPCEWFARPGNFTGTAVGCFYLLLLINEGKYDVSVAFRVIITRSIVHWVSALTNGVSSGGFQLSTVSCWGIEIIGRSNRWARAFVLIDPIARPLLLPAMLSFLRLQHFWHFLLRFDQKTGL